MEVGKKQKRGFFVLPLFGFIYRLEFGFPKAVHIAEGIDRAMGNIREFGFGFNALVREVDVLNGSVDNQGEPFDVVEGSHRMGNAATFRDKFSSFMTHDRDVLFSTRIGGLGDQLCHRRSAAGQRSAAFD
jgi:hypothetical protein